jgi:phosphoribosylamine--glycine ligase
MRILLVGSGGREHALAWRLKQSPSVGEIICPNGNPGIATVAKTPKLPLKSNAQWADYAASERIDLVVVGPEAPLEAGLADELIARGIHVFGPTKAGARIESSKAWAKEVMVKAGVPTARAERFTDAAKAKDYAKSLGLPVVIKADGLAAGKGVTVATTWEMAAQAIDENLVGARFGKSSENILVEEYMEGEEVSIFGLCDGEAVYPLVAAQDHKRVFDGDEGPNTGGMGAYAPAPIATEEIVSAVYGEVLLPTVRYLREQGIVYRGVLFAGLMLTKDGPKVIEFNCRFGDPETQVVLPLLDGDLGEILLACAEGRLAPLTMASPQPGQPGIGTRPDHATTVVLASGGYPGDYKTGLPITGLEGVENQENAMVFHAGTALDASGKLVTAGGRVLAVTAWDRTLARSQERAYALASSISFEGCHYRRDIAHRALRKRG